MWLYLPQSVVCHSAPEAEALTSPCTSPPASSDSGPELFVTLNGKATPRPLSWRGWQMRPWMTRLSGVTLKPSTAALGAAQWIASLQATPASPSVAPASDWLRQIRATFGPTLTASLANAVRGSWSWKTCQATFAWDSEVSAEISSEEATALRLDCSQRQKSAPTTNGNGSSSWPTVRSHEAGEYQVQRDGSTQPTLSGAAQQWSTPRSSPNENRTTKHAPSHGTSHGRTLAGDAVSLNWSTPRASDAEKGGPNQSFGAGGIPLPAQTAQWPTPNASPEAPNNSTNRGKNHGGSRPRLTTQCLSELALSMWPTPKGRDPKGRDPKGQSQRGEHGLMDALPNMAHNWPTPTGPRPKDNENTAGLFFPSQNQADLIKAASHFSHPAPESSINGAPSSDSKRRLNPRFVEWLMGWPVGWTDCASPVTEWSRWKSRMQSSLWALVKQWEK